MSLLRSGKSEAALSVQVQGAPRCRPSDSAADSVGASRVFCVHTFVLFLLFK